MLSITTLKASQNPLGTSSYGRLTSEFGDINGFNMQADFWRGKNKVLRRIDKLQAKLDSTTASLDEQDALARKQGGSGRKETLLRVQEMLKERESEHLSYLAIDMMPDADITDIVESSEAAQELLDSGRSDSPVRALQQSIKNTRTQTR